MRLWAQLAAVLVALALLIIADDDTSKTSLSSTSTHVGRNMRPFCSGAANGRSMRDIPTAIRVQELKAIYENCTRVFGNVEITHLGRETIDFFDDIEEVKGYIYIYNNNVTSVSFKNLRIIWGDTTFDGAALAVETNPSLKEISMPSLKAVYNGGIHIANSNKLCYVRERILFDELVDFDDSRIKVKYYNRSICLQPHTLDRYPCHDSCERGSDGEQHCWGPQKDQCQHLYREQCTNECESRQCYRDEAAQVNRCCDAQCVAGCTGPHSYDCNHCKHFLQCDADKPKHCKCVEQCTPRTRYDAKRGMVVPNPGGFYTHDRYCVKDCPHERLIQGDVCVEHCSPGYYYDSSSDNSSNPKRECRKCDGECPKVCHFNEPITSRNIDQLANCTEIEGFITITKIAFMDHNETGLSNETFTFVPAMMVEDLAVLRSVRIVTEYVYIAADIYLTSASFLENLEIIEGRRLMNTRQALVISSNDNVRELGFRKLRTVKKGDVVISRNFDLCFVSSINWSSIVVQKNSTNIVGNRDDELCASRGDVCHPSCDAAQGCWGTGNNQCRACKKWTQDGQCVDECAENGFFENPTTRTCDRCYEQCRRCHGPGADKCDSCENLKLYIDQKAHSDDEADNEGGIIKKPTPPSTLLKSTKGHNRRIQSLRCFAACPSAQFYVEDGECKRCHNSCYDNGCTGKNNNLGVGGCNNCTYALVSTKNGTDTVDRCLHTTHTTHKANTKDLCLSNDLLDHFVAASTIPGVNAWVCRKCDDECSTCTSAGTSISQNGCQCKNYMSHLTRPGTPPVTDAKCTHECTKWSYMMKAKNGTTIGECGQCHQMCARPDQLKAGEVMCTGPLVSDCTRCVKYQSGSGKSKQCYATCPEGMYPYEKDKTCNYEDLERRDRNVRIAIWVSGITLVIILLLIGVYIWMRSVRYKKELEQEKVANMPELPVLIPMDTYRPNMERIVLIQKDALVCNKNELGRGAFGVVFAGYWIPPGKQLKVPVAIKVVKDPTGKANQEMVEEATKMTMLRHEHLLRIVGVCMSGEDLQLVTLLRPLGNLLRFLQKNRTYLGGKELMVYAYQIASGMKYLAENRVVHRDLAARNVLVKNTQHVEITDFGLAKMIDFDKDSVQVGEGKVAIKWLALECLEKQVYTTSSDVWAFGVTVWEILTYGDSPYVGKSPQQIKDHLIGGQRLAQPNNCSTELYSTLLQCWMGNPDSRPPFAMLKEIFYNYCRAPHAFVVDPLMRNGKLEIGTSQRELIEEIIDETDFEDPQHYFDSEPNTPGVFGSGDSSFPNSMRRMDSTTSGTRYASDPMGGGLQQVGMEDDNYLIPTSKVGEGVSMYTPVVVNEHGQTALVASKNYYNEIVPESEYLNETKSMVKAAAVKRREHSRDARAPALSAIEEDDYPMERESCL